MIAQNRKSFWAIWNMNFGFFGIQFSFGLQQSNMSAIYSYLGADPENLAILWLAGPVTGLLVQPIIGSLSDNTWSKKFGRRKPYFLIGAIMASLALLVMPYSSTVWMAASLLWILDAANNIAMEPYRAFVTDVLPKQQHSFGFLMQSFFTGLGTTLANFTPAILMGLGLISLNDKMANGIPVFTYWAFGIGAIASIGSVLISVLTTKEYPPSEEELKNIEALKKQGKPILRSLMEVIEAFREMPKTMRLLAPVQFFTWFGMFCYWQYITLALNKSLFGNLGAESASFAAAQVLTGGINGSYNIVCFSIAFLLVPIAMRAGLRFTHFISLSLGGISLLLLPYLSDQIILFSIPNPFGSGNFELSQVYLIAIGLGFAWAAMMALPYNMLSASVPKGKIGVYMGIFNMFIVIPMMIQIFTMETFLYDLLGKNPVNVISLAGVFLILGGSLTFLVKIPHKAE